MKLVVIHVFSPANCQCRTKLIQHGSKNLKEAKRQNVYGPDNPQGEAARTLATSAGSGQSPAAQLKCWLGGSEGGNPNEID